jgi:hypothetical protein
MEKAVERDARVPVWSHGGIICTGETSKDKARMTFAKGLTREPVMPPRRFAQSRPARRVQAEGGRHPQGRRARRSPPRGQGEASERVAR